MSLLYLLASLASLASLAPALPPPDDPHAEPPSFFVAILDDASWEDLAQVSTPNLDRLAAEGLSLDRFYVHPLCSPTRYAALFGRYPVRVGIGHGIKSSVPVGLDLDEVCVAEVLGVHGYRTSLFGKWHLGHRDQGAVEELARVQGFQTWRAGNHRAFAEPSHYDWNRFDDGEESPETTYSTRAVADAFVDWMGEREEGAPFFAVWAPFAPHGPFESPPGYPPGEDDRERFEYAVEFWDLELGRVFAELPPNTYVFFLADNGTPNQLQPPGALSPGYKGMPYEGGVRVPAIVTGPGVPAGTRSSALIHVVDLFPTWVELATGEARKLLDDLPLDGRSFVRVLENPGHKHRDWLYTAMFRPNGFEPRYEDRWAVVDARGYKLVSFDGVEELFYLPDGEDTVLDLAVPRWADLADSLRALKRTLDP